VKPIKPAEEVMNQKSRKLLQKADAMREEWLSTGNKTALTMAEMHYSSALTILGKENTKALSELHQRIGEVQLALNRGEAAKKSFALALEAAEPGAHHTTTTMQFVEALIADRKWEEALEEVEKAKRSIHADESIARLTLLQNSSLCLLALERPEEACEAGKQALWGFVDELGLHSQLTESSLRNYLALLKLSKQENLVAGVRAEWYRRDEAERNEWQDKGEQTSATSDQDFTEILRQNAERPIKELSPSGFFITEKIANDQIQQFYNVAGEHAAAYRIGCKATQVSAIAAPEVPIDLGEMAEDELLEGAELSEEEEDFEEDFEGTDATSAEMQQFDEPAVKREEEASRVNAAL